MCAEGTNFDSGLLLPLGCPITVYAGAGRSFSQGLLRWVPAPEAMSFSDVPC